MIILWNIACFTIVLGLLVTVHELGHFLVARKCGVKIECFSIGFGRPLWKKKGSDGVEYALSIIPLGGYVKMLESSKVGGIEGLSSQAFDKKPLFIRSAIVAAGPIFNFLLAIFVYWVALLIGIPSVRPVLEQIEPNSFLDQYHIARNMEINSVSGVETPDWETVNMELSAHTGDDWIQIVVVPPSHSTGPEKKYNVDIRGWSFEPEKGSAARSLGIIPFRPRATTTLAKVSKDSEAFSRGLRPGDRIIAVNGESMNSWQDIANVICSHPNQKMMTEAMRNQELVTVILIPQARVLVSGEAIGFAGLVPKMESWPDCHLFNMRFDPPTAMVKAVQKTSDLVRLHGVTLKKLIAGNVSLRSLGGPIAVAKEAGATAKYGLVYFLLFIALISTNLGVINLLPIPLLDGGHLLFLIIELVFRRSLPKKVQEWGLRVGGAIVFSLMASAILNDLTRL